MATAVGQHFRRPLDLPWARQTRGRRMTWEPHGVERRLTTILAADVVGYSRLMGVDEAGTLAALKGHRQELIDPKVAAHGGRVVKLMGDGMLVEFPSVVDAVHCAVEIQDAMAERNAAVPDATRIVLRIGINLADVIVEGDDIYGDGVNIAARLETLAPPGGLCISRPVYEQVRKRLDFTYRDLGEQTVKNIAEPVHAFVVESGQAPASPWPTGLARPPRPESARASLAVLPFDSLSPDAGGSYLADGIASEVISLLSRVSELRVVSRLASFAYRERGVGALDALRDLGADYLLTGSVRRAGDRIRVIAELTEVAERTQIWSRTYERRFEDMLVVQEELAEAIVIAFGGAYLRAEWRRARHRPTDSLDAWDLVQKARAMHLPDDREAMAEALRLARRAVTADPGYAGAHASLASILMQRVINGFSDDAAQDRAEALAAVDRAIELAPDDPTVLRTAGNVLSNSGKHDKAVRALRRAVETAPFDFHTWGRLGRTLAYGGGAQELREGHAILDNILSTAPDHPMAPYWLAFKANAYARDDRYAQAAEFARKSIEARPAYSGAWIALANALGQLGRLDEAREAMARARRANPAMRPDTWRRRSASSPATTASARRRRYRASGRRVYSRHARFHRRTLPMAKATIVAALLITAAVAAPAGAQTIASGEFSGESGHKASGGVSVEQSAGGPVVVLGSDFRFDGAPDPKLGFGKGGYDQSTKFSALKANSGAQTYKLPPSIDPADYDEVWLWCEQYAVPLGRATLKTE